MRLLVLDHTGILSWIIAHELGADTQVECVHDLATAEQVVRDHPPDAAVVNVPPAHLAWGEFQHLCATRNPPVPVLYDALTTTPELAAVLSRPEGYAVLLDKPAGRWQLRCALDGLLAEARRQRDATKPSH